MSKHPLPRFGGPASTSCRMSRGGLKQSEVGSILWNRPDPAERIVAVLLQIHVNMNVITSLGMCFASEISFDELLPEFRATTNLAASIIGELFGSSEESAFYRFDLGIIPALYLVGTRCRDRVVRGRAIDLMLLSSQIREGVRDFFCIGSISNHVPIEEEGGLPGEDCIPESRNIFITSVDAECGRCPRESFSYSGHLLWFSLSTMSQYLFYTQRSGPQDEDLVFNKSLVIWGVRIFPRSYSDYRNGLMKAW
jgi:hypothetical protein